MTGTPCHGGKDPTRAARRGSDWQLAVLMCRLCGDAVRHPCHFRHHPPPPPARQAAAPPVRRRGAGPDPPPAARLRPARPPAGLPWLPHGRSVRAARAAAGAGARALCWSQRNRLQLPAADRRIGGGMTLKSGRSASAGSMRTALSDLYLEHLLQNRAKPEVSGGWRAAPPSSPDPPPAAAPAPPRRARLCPLRPPSPPRPGREPPSAPPSARALSPAPCPQLWPGTEPPGVHLRPAPPAHAAGSRAPKAETLRREGGGRPGPCPVCATAGPQHPRSRASRWGAGGALGEWPASVAGTAWEEGGGCRGGRLQHPATEELVLVLLQSFSWSELELPVT